MMSAISERVPVTGGSRPQRSRARGFRKATSHTFPLVPAMVLLAVFLIGPILTAFYGSFTDMALRGTAAEHARWVGLRNYTDLFSRPDFANSVLLTVVFVLFTVAGENVIGMVLALATRNGNRVVAAIVGTIVIGVFALPE